MVERLVRDTGGAVARLVPFDLLGPFSPWRLGAPPGVLDELAHHLRAASVRRLAATVEAAIAPALAPAQAGRVLMAIAPRPDATCATVPPDLRMALDDPTLRAAVVTALYDDAVVHFAAFLDGALLGPLGIPFDLPGYVARASADPSLAGPAMAAARRRRQWRSPGIERKRFLEGATHRLAARLLSALDAPEGTPGGEVGPSLEYGLVSALQRVLEQHRDDGVPG